MDEGQIKSSYKFKAHVVTVLSFFNAVVCNLDQPAVVEVLMTKMGETHRQRKVDAKHFDEIKTILMEILKKDVAVGDDAARSWERFINYMYQHSLRKKVDTKV
ncbi:hypothetical protein evm_007240 [Chilo suppressalis]|nr:hypothetical protein evm_007240 [Chilo suppressalis]